MKLFKHLLVAPAALGLMAPIAATAAELNVNGVSEYSNNGDIESISQFSNVYSTDWEYQALINLAERHGCVALVRNKRMTRYEAAALLNKCLENVSKVNEEEQRLLDEFAPELAAIKASVLDGVEAGMMDHSGHGHSGMSHGGGGFSPTTMIMGKTTFVVGGIGTNSGTGFDQGSAGSATNPDQKEAVTFNYDTKLMAHTSFTGKDLLKTVVRTANFTGTDPFGMMGPARLETAFGSGDELRLHRAYYQFPIGEEWTATIGPELRQDDMLGVWPSAYPSDAVLNILTFAGAPDAYSKKMGAGVGVTWSNDNLVASALLVSEDADNASSQEGTAGGILTAHGKDTITTQLAWVDDNFTVAAAYSHADNGNWNDSVDGSDYSAYAISGVYNLDNDSEWMPSSISAGMGWKNPDQEDPTDSATNKTEDGQTWTIGLLWNDAFVDGNNLGFGLGTAETHRDDTGYDDPLAWEVFYQMSVSDNITVTPAIFVIQRDNERNDDITGALVKTTFKF